MTDSGATLSRVLARLQSAGYETTFCADADGLRALDSQKLHAPESLIVDETVRFEGETNPADQAVVSAPRCPRTGVQGTYVTAYGPKMDALDAECARRLE